MGNTGLTLGATISSSSSAFSYPPSPCLAPTPALHALLKKVEFGDLWILFQFWNAYQFSESFSSLRKLTWKHNLIYSLLLNNKDVVSVKH